MIFLQSQVPTDQIADLFIPAKKELEILPSK